MVGLAIGLKLGTTGHGLHLHPISDVEVIWGDSCEAISALSRQEWRNSA